MSMTATGLSSFGGQNLMRMMNDMGISNSLVAMLTSCNPHAGFRVSSSGGGLEEEATGRGQKRPHYPISDKGPGEEPEEGDDCCYDGAHPMEKKRRLSFEQVRSLERNFEMENKLEPDRKMKLAKELGLQPRQIAVWFQNRRARWKTKQLERDFELLNSGYSKLKRDFEKVLEEKDVLKAELVRLSAKIIPKDSQSVDFSQSEKDSHCKPTANDPAKSDKLKESKPATPKDNQSTRSSPTTVVCSATTLEAEITSTSSGSNSSDLLDADSPRTTDSNPREEQLANYCGQLLPENFVGHLTVEEAVNTSQKVYSVKLEDGCHHFQVDATSGYFLPPMAEQSILPWWDWP